ncbi:MAG: tetratricopeptide repeat protein [Proteobacteria bacterium]|nr:tetratricopeptide repeat protein [Pseudomonadota bacterium]
MINRKHVYLILLVFGIPVNASEITAALNAYENEDYQTAYKQLTQLALKDNAEAQYNLAFMYFGGDGIPQDDVKAAFWFEQAAKSGHAGAQDKLAYMYLHGGGLDTDRVQAYAWYSVAADNGIFLAKNVSEILKNQMGTTERVHADLLSLEYLKKFKK